jgi:molybdate transport system substrate-binding protein
MGERCSAYYYGCAAGEREIRSRKQQAPEIESIHRSIFGWPPLCTLHNGRVGTIAEFFRMVFLNVTLTVFAAASLHVAMPAIGHAFEAVNPGVTIRFDFDGSQVLVAQIEQGAMADVLATADTKNMKSAQDAGFVGPSTVFAQNALTIVTPMSSPVKIASDLASPNVKVALCVVSAPCGHYAIDALKAMNIPANVATQEINVEGVMEKVKLNEVDAGIVYVSDAATAKQGTLRTIVIPSYDQQPVNYPAAAVKGSANADVAAKFIAFLTSAKAQAILRQFGFQRI